MKKNYLLICCVGLLFLLPTLELSAKNQSVLPVQALVLNDTTVLYDTICYTGSGFYPFVENRTLPKSDTTVTAKYTANLKTILDADSVVVLYLTVYPTFEGNDTIQIYQSELPYDYEGWTLGSSGRHTILLETTLGCDSIINLIVEFKTGLTNQSYNQDLILYPNPLIKGQNVYIKKDFSTDELQNMKIEIFNSVGILISNEANFSQPLKVKLPEQSGFYLVRVTTGTKEHYTGRVFVY